MIRATAFNSLTSKFDAGVIVTSPVKLKFLLQLLQFVVSYGTNVLRFAYRASILSFPINNHDLIA